MLPEILSIVIGYLLGSIPSAYLIARWRKGIDIRDVDVRNMGGGSVLRQVGVWEGIVVIVVDMAKGAAAIFSARALGVSLPWELAAGFAAILGHNYPVYVGFRGGQGVATIMGIYFVIAPYAMAAVFCVLGVILLLTRRKFTRFLFVIVSVVSPLLAFFIWLIYDSKMLLYYTLVIIVILLLKNRRRLAEIKILKTVFRRKQQQSAIEHGDSGQSTVE
jgi:glycerol-3-phosphate acyltransferase PlsY